MRRVLRGIAVLAALGAFGFGASAGAETWRTNFGEATVQAPVGDVAVWSYAGRTGIAPGRIFIPGLPAAASRIGAFEGYYVVPDPGPNEPACDVWREDLQTGECEAVWGRFHVTFDTDDHWEARWEHCAADPTRLWFIAK